MRYLADVQPEVYLVDKRLIHAEIITKSAN